MNFAKWLLLLVLLVVQFKKLGNYAYLSLRKHLIQIKRLNSPCHPAMLWHMDRHGEGGEVAEREIFPAESEIFLLDLIGTCGLEGDFGLEVVLTS